MVNDFGAINVDASLIEAADDDMIALTNGCVCCTMGADLFLAIGDVLNRAEWPDHLVIEASGIADPAAIAQVALAEPDLAYGGIVTVVDAEGFGPLSRDAQIGPQLRGQVDVADVIVVSKTGGVLWPEGVPQDAIDLAKVQTVAPLICGQRTREVPQAGGRHQSYLHWTTAAARPMARAALIAALKARPAGLFRVKGFVAGPGGDTWAVQCVGQQVDVRAGQGPLGLVGIGLRGRVQRAEVDAWWRRSERGAEG
mmetsp:Transcript_22620/g.37004  ORF Transcript_22620/g.37004 Transcript_22620/m.37004 type:complete len:254 (-) Transcript_22620:778-1539(-)